MKELEYEKQKLKNVQMKLKETKEDEEITFSNLPKKYGANPRLLENLMSISAIKINNIVKIMDKPYFARIDFKEDGRELEKFYIGKIGVLDQNGKSIVTDWRAPVATLYYDSNLGRVQYDAPKGIIQGDMSLKRQIVIENGDVESIYDVDSVSDDELLKPYLGASADSRLKSIVATIQSEQNDIIRKDINTNLVVQGVAGSGKTTVALHRIAYLMYNNSDKYKANQFMVIGPNKFFLNYISNVLPDLDAGSALQFTYEELAAKFIGEKIIFEDSTKKLADIISKNVDYDYIKFKMSIKYKELLDNYLNKVENALFSRDGFIINNIIVLDRDYIFNVYKTINGNSVNQRAIMTAKVIANRIKNDTSFYDELKKKIDKEIIDEENIEKKKKLQAMKLKMLKELESKGFEEQLKKYVSIQNLKVLKIYEEFIKELRDNDTPIISKLKEETLKRIKLKVLENEDIPALMYIKYYLYGNEEFSDIKCTIVDESQDFGEFSFYMLNSILPNTKFSIFGDMAQGIYAYRGINDWNYLTDTLLKDCTMLELRKSYRTSIEIMQEANKISKAIGLGEANPVIRSSGPVVKTKIEKAKQDEYIVNQVKKYLNDGYKSIAIIYKNTDKMVELNKKFKENNIESEIIYKDQESYNGGVCILTSYLSKGLEFDVVIVLDVEESTYSSENILDMKLLYVAMTRALHKLELINDNNIVKWLE